MAVLISCATGNFTTASTWALVDSTSYLNSESGNTALTTSYVASSSSTTGVITIDAIAVKIASRSASPTGTMSVELYNSTLSASVSGTEVTIDVADLPTCDTTHIEGGWVVFKFASPVLLLTATNYQVRAKTSSSSMVNLYRDGTAANWSRMLRTTTTQAPASTNDLVVAGEHTGSGTGNSLTVTMDNTATTVFGGTLSSDVTPSLAICKRGTLTYGVTASTNYKLYLLGCAVVYNGGALNIGTSGTPVPITSTAILQTDGATAVQAVLFRNGSTVNTYGSPRTAGKSVVQCKLNANAAAAATSLSVDTDTGWLSGDTIVFASTSQTPGQYETAVMSSGASASALPVPAIANAHLGTAPTQAEVGLLTHNVKIQSSSASFCVSIGADNTATWNGQFLEMYRCGGAVATYTPDTRGLRLQTTTGAVNLNYFSLHDVLQNNGIRLTGTAHNNISLQNGVIGVSSVTTNYQALLVDATTGTTWTLNNLLFIGTTNSSGTDSLRFNDLGGTITNITATSITGTGLPIIVLSDIISGTGTVSGVVAHSNACSIGIDGVWYGTVTGLSSWRNNCSTAGMRLTAGAPTTFYGPMVAGCGAIFGNATLGLSIVASAGALTVNTPAINGDTTFATTTALALPALGTTGGTIVINGLNTAASGILTAPTTDVSLTSSSTMSAGEAILNSPIFGANVITGQTAMGFRQALKMTNIGGSNSGNHQTLYRNGTVRSDLTYFNTASPGERMTPNSAAISTYKLEAGRQVFTCDNGGTKTVGVSVRVDSTYTGAAPRLILKANGAMGLNADSVLATWSGSTNAWVALSGVTPAAAMDGAWEVVLDSDTGGFITGDDWSVAA